MTVRALNCCLLLVILTTSVRPQTSESWTGGINRLLKSCSPKPTDSSRKPFLDSLRHCLQRRALVALDAVLSDDVIPVVSGVDLVRYGQGSGNDTDRQFNQKEQNARDSGKTWREIIFARFGRVFKTHVLRIDVDRLINSGNSTELTRDGSGDGIVEGRRRHHRRRQHMMPMMVMGLLIMGSVLIPMGFQFLAVLGGKALLLAKLALMLSSIQGLKKIATNGVNYGLYHSPVAEGWHERSHHESASPYDVPWQAYQRP